MSPSCARLFPGLVQTSLLLTDVRHLTDAWLSTRPSVHDSLEAGGDKLVLGVGRTMLGVAKARMLRQLVDVV